MLLGLSLILQLLYLLVLFLVISLSYKDMTKNKINRYNNYKTKDKSNS